jgi:hypothetical protein
MNDTFEAWSLPWHALQRNLALALGGDATSHSGRSPTAAVNFCAGSWLGKAQRRTPPPPLRQ